MKTKTIEKSSDSSPKKDLPTNCPFDFDICRKALISLKQLISSAQQGHKKLLDDSAGISLYLHVHKIPRCTYLRISSELPHPIASSDTREVCLIVRDDDVNGREYESTVRRYQSMIEQFKLPFRIDVMTLKQLNQELVPYEAKRKLCARYDLFLADRRVITSLMRGQLLGKHFRHHGKMPVGINVFNKDFKQRLLALCSSTYGRMAGTGPLFSMPFTTLEQSIDHGIENFKTICQKLEKEFPGGWNNVAHAHFYGTNLQSLPIYYSSQTKNEVKQLNVTSDEKQKLTAIGELTTLDKNLSVIVEPDGHVHLTKRKQLKPVTKKKDKKRLQKTWLKGVVLNKRLMKTKSNKTPKTVAKDEEIFANVNDGKVVETAFVERVTKTRLAKKDEKLQHVEQTFADKPAPKAEKRKRLLAAAKQAKARIENEDVPMLVDADAEERKIKSGGRSKKIRA